MIKYGHIIHALPLLRCTYDRNNQTKQHMGELTGEGFRMSVFVHVAQVLGHGY